MEAAIDRRDMDIEGPGDVADGLPLLDELASDGALIRAQFGGTPERNAACLDGAASFLRSGGDQRALHSGTRPPARTDALMRLPAPATRHDAARRGPVIVNALDTLRSRNSDRKDFAIVARRLLDGVGADLIARTAERECERLRTSAADACSRPHWTADAYAQHVAPALAPLGDRPEAAAALVAESIRDPDTRDRTMTEIGRRGGPTSRAAWAKDIASRLAELEGTTAALVTAHRRAEPFLTTMELRPRDEQPSPPEEDDRVDPEIANAVRALRAMIGAEPDPATRERALTAFLTKVLSSPPADPLRGLLLGWTRALVTGRTDATALEAALVAGAHPRLAPRIAHVAVANYSRHPDRLSLLGTIAAESLASESGAAWARSRLTTATVPLRVPRRPRARRSRASRRRGAPRTRPPRDLTRSRRKRQSGRRRSPANARATLDTRQQNTTRPRCRYRGATRLGRQPAPITRNGVASLPRTNPDWRPMPPRELRLPRYARQVLERLEDQELALLGRTAAALGGGTALAARWQDHRESRDLDIFIPAARFDALFPLINNMQMAMQARLDPTIEPRQWTNHQAGVLVIRVTSPDADVELIRDPHRSLTRDWTHGEETVEGTTRRLKTVSTIAVLQRKLENRIHALAERDLYDVAWAARFERPALDEALDRCSYPTIRHFARLLENLTEVPAREEEHKPVVHPKWEKWRTEAPPILRQTIGETLTRWNTLHRSGPAKSIGE